MNFTFLRATGEVAFFRSDAEQADWTQEEMNLSCTFPYLPDKVIERGMIVLFQDPATDSWQAYEIRQCQTMAGDSSQQFTAEDLAISELSDCHIPEKIELTNVTADYAIQLVLSGTGWQMGTGLPNVSSGDINRGTVWNAVNVIRDNWNVYIVSRVTVDMNGISGRYLDLQSTAGFDRGLRLAVNKNVTDPCVIYDDTELYTALYGYGGTYSTGERDARQTHEYDFSSVTWDKTADHPAKPAGQKYLEYPEMTALFGRNGKPRFGYYQNTNIKDPNVLLQKTWESLKQCCEPKVSITGTVADLKRLGYADVPLRLYDLAIVELEPIGLLLYKQVVKLTVDLLDPTKNLPTIGDYIPNIIYISRDTEEKASGNSGGGGGGGGRRGPSTKTDLEFSEWRTNTIDNGRQIELNAQHIDVQENILQQAGMYIDSETGVLIYAEDNVNMIGSKFHVQSDRITAEVTDRKNSDSQLSSRITQTANAITLEVSERKSADNALSGRINVEKDRITAEVTNRQSADNALSGRITVAADAITAEVTRATGAEEGLSGRITVEADRISLVVTDGANPQIKPAAIVSSINNGASSILLSADHIDIDGLVTKLSAKNIGCANLTTQNSIDCGQNISADGYIYAGSYIWAESIRVGSGATGATWKSFTYRYCNLSTERAFMYGSTVEASGTITGHVVIGYTDTTIHYLGR